MIKVISIGKIKDKNLKALCDEYTKRIKKYHKIEVIEVADESIPNKLSEKDIDIILNKEAERVLNKIKDEYVILLDIHGKEMSSIKFAEELDKINTYNSSNITFVIGGSLGLSDKLRKRANKLLKLSEMTFLHQMTRLILLEQIYRAFKINNNENYNK